MLASFDTRKSRVGFQIDDHSPIFNALVAMPDSTETILFETSPFGTLDGIVEHDGRVVYFYLNERKPDTNPGSSDAERFGTRACWVRNLERGPIVLSKPDMAAGKAPLMPRNDCIDATLSRLPSAESLEIVWLEEGNGAALIETDPASGERVTIAVIPPWSGIDGFHGYAANCAHETPLAWPMPENPSLMLRIKRAKEFWDSFTDTGSPFTSLQPRLLSVMDKHFSNLGPQEYFSIDGGKFPPRGLVQYQSEYETVLLTVGMSMCAQPAVELFVDHPADHRRIEMGVRLPYGSEHQNPETVSVAMRSISSFAAYPWNHWTWLGPGHSIGWEFSPSGQATLVKDEQIDLGSFRDDPVHLLWIEV